MLCLNSLLVIFVTKRFWRIKSKESFSFLGFQRVIFTCRLLFLYEGKVVWQGMTREFRTSTNPIVQQVVTQSLFLVFFVNDKSSSVEDSTGGKFKILFLDLGSS